jgi:hypothetical protein
MNIFEDLVEELKEENLLENTVIEQHNSFPKQVDNGLKAESTAIHGNEMSQNFETFQEQTDDLVDEDENFEIAAENFDVENFEKANEIVGQEDNEKDFYKQRAIDEVTGLQMVEHVLSGIEREQMKSLAIAYNDVKVKQALHNFLKIEDIKSPEHAQAEFHLMQETEDWYSSLSRRDRNIVVAQFRRFCEQTKPSLSSRALMSLARFYRNSPYSESVRSKFDLIVTRLFTKESGNEKREMLFSKGEITQHLKELYADWSSVPLYSIQDDDSEILLSMLQFQEFIDEIQEADTFNELITADFFKRVKVFKEKTSENFFSPQLVSAAIECNVIVGNKYVELIKKDKNASKFSEQYGILHDEAISDATSKTLELVELLKVKQPLETAKEPPKRLTDKLTEKQNKANSEVYQKPEKSNSVLESLESKPFKVNKWLVVCTVILFVFAFVFHFSGWNSDVSNNNAADLSPDVKKVNITRSFISEQMQDARISKDTFFAVTKPTWKNLQDSEKENFLGKIRSLGNGKNFTKVMIIDESGKVVASANQEKTFLYPQ